MPRHDSIDPTATMTDEMRRHLDTLPQTGPAALRMPELESDYDYLLRAVDAGKWPIQYNGGWLWEPEALRMMERYERVHDIANVCPVDVYVGSQAPSHGRVSADDALQGGLIRILMREPTLLGARMMVHAEKGKRKSEF